MVEPQEPMRSIRVHLTLPGAEHIEPFNLAMKQLDSLYEWGKLQPAGGWPFEHASVLQAVAAFHPDSQYKGITRVPRLDAHAVPVWLSYERCEFEGEQIASWTALAVAKGFGDVATYGPTDHRGLALGIAARLSVYEGEKLREAHRINPSDVGTLWRRLYWFTRFFRAWQRIGATVPAAKYKHDADRAAKARSWKRDAWAYYLKQAPRVQSVRTIASNFVKGRTGAKAHEVQTYIGDRLALSNPRNGAPKKTVRRPSPNTRP